MANRPLWWLSFADAELPKGSQFLGACIVPAGSIIEAVQIAHAMGVNPGGDVVGHPIPESDAWLLAAQPTLRTYVGRILTRDECETLDRELARIGRA